MHNFIRRSFTASAVTALVLVAPGLPAAYADPATELPPSACNDGTARADSNSSANANTPVPPHGNHGCHVHRPS